LYGNAGAGYLEENHADGIRYFEAPPSRVEGASFLIDGKDMKVPAELVGRDDPLTRRVQVEVARGSPPGLLEVDQAQFSATLVDVKTGDAVMATIGGVKKSSAGMDEDFRGGSPGPPIRDSGDGLDFCELAAGLAVAEGRDRAGDLVEDIAERGLRVESEVAWPRSRVDRGCPAAFAETPPLFEFVADDLVHSQVGDEYKPVGGVEVDGVGVGLCLPGVEDTRTLVENSIKGFTEGSVIPDLNRGDGRPCVIRNNDGIVLWSKNKMAGVCSMGADGVEFFQHPVARVGNAVGGYRTRSFAIEIVGLINGIEELPVWLQSKEGRARRFGREAEPR